MTAPLPVLVNLSASAAAAAGEGLPGAIQRAFSGMGLPIQLELLAPAELPRAFARHAGSPVIVVGGGDGTVSAAAGHFSRSSTALGILPLGSRNRFATRIGVPSDLALAARTAVTGERRRIDVGCIAPGHMFIDSALLGRVATDNLVEARCPGWLARLLSAWRALHRQRFHLRVEGRRRDVRAPFLLVGNGAGVAAPQGALSGSGGLGGHGLAGSGLAGSGLGGAGRDLLADAELSVCAPDARHPFGSAAFAMRVLSGRARLGRHLAEVDAAQEVLVEGSGEMPLVLDGELVRLRLPLRFAVLPSALGVVVPRVPAMPSRVVVRTG